VSGDSDIEVERLRKTLIPLSEWPQRAALVARQLTTMPPEDAALLFARICTRACAEKTDDAIIAAHAVFFAVLWGYWEEDHLLRTREAAAAQENRITLRLLQPLRFPDADAEEFEVPKYRTDRILTLGERKTLATTPSRRAIEKAMMDPHPQVAKKLLDNPRLTETDVVRICARRMMAPSVLCEVALHVRWRERPSVHQALVNNRSLPASFAVSFLPFLDVRTLREITLDRPLDPDPREAAGALLEGVLYAV